MSVHPRLSLPLLTTATARERRDMTSAEQTTDVLATLTALLREP
jgi:hypothetical protein